MKHHFREFVRLQKIRFDLIDSLPDNKTSDILKLITFVNFNINVTRKLSFSGEMVKMIIKKNVRNGENAGNQYFLLSPQCFQQPQSINVENCMLKT